MTDRATLTDRYIDAAMRTVPERQRPDLAAELRGSIADQIDARVEAGEQTDAAEHAVLTELGDPDELAAGYTDRPLWLVGPRYYLDWWRLLKLLLWIVPVCAAFGVALGTTISGQSIGEIIGTTIGVTFSVIVHVAFWTTLVFAIIERSTGGADIRLTGEWTPDRLPERRETGARLSDLVASLVLLALVAGAVLWDRFLGLVFLDGEWMPALSPALWPWWIAALLAYLVVEAVFAVVLYARRAWTVPLAVVNGVLNLLLAVAALWLLWDGRLVNPEVTARLVELAGPGVFGAGGVVTIVIGFVIAGIASWDTIDGALKAVRARRTTSRVVE